MRIKITEVKELNFEGCEIWKPEFRDMSIQDIEDTLQEQLQSYVDVGYNSITFHRETAIVFIRKVEIKTLENIFETDIFGLLK